MSDHLRAALEERLRRDESELEAVLRHLRGVRAKLARVSTLLSGLLGRLRAVRKRGYAFFRDLDARLSSLREGWRSMEEELSAKLAALETWASMELEVARSALRDARWRLEANELEGARARLSDAELKLGEIKGRLEVELGAIERALAPFANSCEEVDKVLKLIEASLPLFESASFPLRPGESWLFAARGRLLGEEKVKGVFYMTDQRILFEAHREVVVKRIFLIFAQKRVERELLVDVPYELVDSMSKGIVGLLAGYGVRVTAPRAGVEELVVDLKGEEADFVIRAFDYVRSGRAAADKVMS